MPKGKSFFEKLTGSTSQYDKEPKMVDFEDYTPSSSRPKESKEPEGQLAIDVYQTESEIVIKSTIAGVNPEDLDITITKDMVTIRGNRPEDEKINSENYFYQECYWGPFSRSVILPEEIEADTAEATMKNGILTIILPKASKVKTKKLKVKLEE